MIRQAQSRAKEARVKVARLLGRRATSRNERSEAKELSPRRIQVPLKRAGEVDIRDKSLHFS